MKKIAYLRKQVAIRFDAGCRCLLGFCASALDHFSAQMCRLNTFLRHGIKDRLIHFGGTVTNNAKSITDKREIACQNYAKLKDIG
jgi:hypothetical protein